MTTRIFRWKAISALGAVVVVLGGLWAIFGDWVVKRGIERVGSEVLGAEVDLASLRILEMRAAVELRGLEIASSFDSTRDLFQAGTIALSLEPMALFEKKVIVDRLTLTGMRFMVARERPARSYASTTGIASRLRSETAAWAEKVKAPLLSLTPIDTIRSIVLDPSSLATLKAVDRVTKRADSVKGAFERGVADLHLPPLLDSTQALAKRLSTAKAAGLGVVDVAQSVQAAKRAIDQLEQAKRQIARLEQNARAGAMLLAQDVGAVDSARRSDYEFAKGLLRLPKLEAPNIAAALFGAVSVERFQQAIYWARMAQEYFPPGLNPSPHSGPPRARRAGRTYSFPREHTDPSFLLRRGELGFALGGDHETGVFTGTVTGLTTQPELYGRPATLTAAGATTGAHAIQASVGAVLDHTRTPTHDSARVRMSGIELERIALPGLPFTVEPGRGSSELTIELERGQLAGRWSMRSTEAVWHVDPAAARSLNTLEGAMWQVLSGLRELDVTAELSGELTSPRFSVRSNIDQAVATRLRAIVAAELAKGEARARAAVDKLVAARVEPIARQAADVSALLGARLGGSKSQLDQVQQQLEREIKRLAGPATLFPIPKFRP